MRGSRFEARLAASFDHPISAHKQRWRDGETERLRGLEIDDQLERRGLLDRKITSLGAPEDLVHKACSPAELVCRT